MYMYTYFACGLVYCFAMKLWFVPIEHVITKTGGSSAVTFTVCVWYWMCYDFDAIFMLKTYPLLCVLGIVSTHSCADEHCICNFIHMPFHGFHIQPQGYQSLYMVSTKV